MALDCKDMTLWSNMFNRFEPNMSHPHFITETKTWETLECTAHRLSFLSDNLSDIFSNDETMLADADEDLKEEWWKEWLESENTAMGMVQQAMHDRVHGCRSVYLQHGLAHELGHFHLAT
jgi:hypothetical protein